MYFLSLETSTKIFSLALSRDEKVLRFRNIKSTLALENAMVPALKRILKSSGMVLGQMDGFAVSLGPGSFTSLRMGLSTVKALHFVTHKPVVGIGTLDIIAHGVFHQHPLSWDTLCVLNDARRGKVYAALYDAQGKTLTRRGDFLLASLEDVLARLKGKTLFVGDALKVYGKDIEKKWTLSFFADEKLWQPQARVMAALAFRRFEQKSYDDAASLLPLYLYAHDCQVTHA